MSNFLATSILLVGLANVAPAYAQSSDTTEARPPKHKKKKKKPAPAPPPQDADTSSGDAASSSGTTTAADAPTATTSAADASGTAPASDAAEPSAHPAASSATAEGPPPIVTPATDTREDPQKRYYFVGLRYRGTVLPQFLLNAFVDEGTTIYMNTIGAEVDVRKGSQSMIPWIVYTDFSTGDILFHQKGTSTIPGNYSVVHSTLKTIMIGLDELWSAPLDAAHHWDFEYGFGVGVGILFGDLGNNWVFPNSQGPLHASTGQNYSACQTQNDGMGCSTADHQNASIAKVGGYKEPFLFSGGAVPNILPNVWFPTLGVRYKPIKSFEARLGLGLSLTGFWFGVSGDYGLEKTDHPATEPASSSLRMHDML